jgi:hypothetical protein
VGDPLELVLSALDGCISRILERAGPRTTVILLSSHGMGPGYFTRELLEPILRRLEATPGTRSSIYGRLRVAWDTLPQQIQRPLARTKDLFREHLLENDRARRLCFALPASNDGGSIRLNVMGREPQGRIRPGADYDAHCRWLTDELKAVVNAETGEPVVREVYRPRDFMRGEMEDVLPDLTIEWRADSPIRRIRSPRIGEIPVSLSPWRSAEHLPQGLIVGRGPGISPGPITTEVRAQDLAPTVGRLLGVPMPDLDGTPIEGMGPAGS